MFPKDGFSTDGSSTDSVRQAAVVPVIKVECLDMHRAKVRARCRTEHNIKLTQSNHPEAKQGQHDIGKDVVTLPRKNTPATLLILAERFPYCASIEVNDVHWVRAQFSARTRDQLIATVKKILCQEFGRKRVERDSFHFVVKHGNIDKLIKKLVQVQFYTNQILLPEYNLMGERNELNGVSITWGVGRDQPQATEDRIRKRNQKYYRR